MWYALNEIKLLLKDAENPALHQTPCKASCQFLPVFLKAHPSYDRVQMDLTSAAALGSKLANSPLIIDLACQVPASIIAALAHGALELKASITFVWKGLSSFWLRNPIFLPHHTHDFHTGGCFPVQVKPLS